jgi:hypothetical protein
MSIIRDVRERVLTKPRKLQPQAPGNQVLRISLVILSLVLRFRNDVQVARDGVQSEDL